MSELQTQNITEADVVLGKIANGLQSAASDHILGIAKDIYDTKQKAYQEDINEYLLNKVNDTNQDFLDAVLERDVYAELSVGGILEGTTLTKGMTFTTFVERLLTLINVGSIKSPIGEGTVSIEAPTIIVEKEENGTWVKIKSGTTVKENTKVRVRITNIPESSFEKIFAGIKQGGTNPGDVLAYGWIKSVDGGDAVFGEGHCEISTYTDVTGEDHLTISIANGDFDGLEINSEGKINNTEFTISASSSTLQTQVGEIKVQSNSAKYQLKSANDFEIAAVTSKHTSKPEKMDEISSDRKITINKDTNIDSEKYSSNYSTFILNVEGWGVVPSLTTGGTVSIKAPEIKVYNVTEQKYVSSGVELNPNHTIKVEVNLNGKSTISGDSASLIKSTDSEFKYGWEKTKGTGTAVTGSGNCKIGTIISHVGDVLDFTGTKNGLFNNSDFKIEDNNKISFTKNVGNENSEFSIVAKSGRHRLLADDNYNVYALSSIGSSGRSTNMNNHYSCNKDEVLKTYNTKTSSASRFYFTVLEELWSNIPQIVRTGGVVSFGNPTIYVEKEENGSWKEITSGAVLDPSDKLNITITLPQQSTISTPTAYYTPNASANQLKYGWKLLQNGVETTGEPTDTCNIELKYTNENDTHTITGTGAFEGLSTTTLTKTGVSVGTEGSLTISSKHGTYTISPKYNDCKIYALSSFGNTDENHLQTPPSKTITGTTKTATFTYTVKAATYSSFYAWDVKDFMPIFNSLNELNGNASDEDIISTGLTKYTGVVSGGKLNNGYVVAFAKTTPKLYNETGSPVSNSDWLEIDNNYPGSRKLYVFPSGDPSNVVWKNLTINE